MGTVKKSSPISNGQTVQKRKTRSHSVNSESGSDSEEEHNTSKRLKQSNILKQNENVEDIEKEPQSKLLKKQDLDPDDIHLQKRKTRNQKILEEEEVEAKESGSDKE